jgi:hypothetical protein
MSWPATICVSYIIFAISFGVAHWLFAFEYFSIAKLMPRALKGEMITEQMLKTYETLKLAFVGVFVMTLLA